MPKAPTDLALPPGLEGVRGALVRAQSHDLADLYDAWRELLVAQGGAVAARVRELEALDVRAQMVLRSVESARSLIAGPPKARKRRGGKVHEGVLASADPLAGFVAESQREIEAASAALARRAIEEERFFAAQIARVKQRLRQRTEALLAAHRPRLEARVQPVGRDRSMIHVSRPEPQELLLFAWAATGRLFTRYDAFSDDSVDQLGLEAARFFAEEGLENVRFERPEDEEAYLDAPDRVFLPVKGMLPLCVPGHAFPRFRLINRGPLMELEAREQGGPWEHVMPRASAELFSGWLIKLKIDKRIELSLRVA